MRRDHLFGWPPALDAVDVPTDYQLRKVTRTPRRLPEPVDPSANATDRYIKHLFNHFIKGEPWTGLRCVGKTTNLTFNGMTLKVPPPESVGLVSVDMRVATAALTSAFNEYGVHPKIAEWHAHAHGNSSSQLADKYASGGVISGQRYQANFGGRENTPELIEGYGGKPPTGRLTIRIDSSKTFTTPELSALVNEQIARDLRAAREEHHSLERQQTVDDLNAAMTELRGALVALMNATSKDVVKELMEFFGVKKLADIRSHALALNITRAAKDELEQRLQRPDDQAATAPIPPVLPMGMRWFKEPPAEAGWYVATRRDSKSHKALSGKLMRHFTPGKGWSVAVAVVADPSLIGVLPARYPEKSIEWAVRVG